MRKCTPYPISLLLSCLLPILLGQAELFAINNGASSTQDSAWQSLSDQFESLAQLEPPPGRHSAMWRLQQHGKIFAQASTLLDKSHNPIGEDLIRSHLSPCRSLPSTCNLLLHSNPLSKESRQLLRDACPTCRFAVSDSTAWTILHSIGDNESFQDGSFRDELIDSTLKRTTTIDQIDSSILRIYLHSISEAIKNPSNQDIHTKLNRAISHSGLANGFSHLLPPGIIINDIDSVSLQAFLKKQGPSCTTYSAGGFRSIFPSNRWWSQNLDPITYQKFSAYLKVITSSASDLNDDLTESYIILDNSYPYTPSFYAAYFPLDGSINGLLKKRYRSIISNFHHSSCKNPAFTKFATEYIKRGRDQKFKQMLKSILCK